MICYSCAIEINAGDEVLSAILATFAAKRLMFAVIKTGGKQYLVREGDTLEIEKLEVEAGKPVSFEALLLS